MNLKKKLFSFVSAMCISITAFTNTSFLNVNASTIYGDVNNDGRVDISDMVIANRFLLGKIPYSSINLKYTDVDRNTVIDVNDSKTLLSYMANGIASLPYSESGFLPNAENYTYTFPADDSRDYVKYDCQTGSESNYTLEASSEITAFSGGIDDRVIDSSDNAQAIVYLSFKESNGNYYRGTGFIVSDHVIATCAHCLYDGQNFNTDYKVFVYNAEGTSVAATYSAKQLHIPKHYYDSDPNDYDYNYDYGLIYVEEDLSAYGNIALGIATDSFKDTSQEVCVSGFPSTVNGIYTYYRYYGIGKITEDTTSFQLFYTTYANSGDSGGPVYIEYTLNGEKFRSAIGIHASGYPDGSTHSGTRITLPLLRFYNNNMYVG